MAAPSKSDCGASALEGKANAALISFLPEELKISKRAIVLERGQKSRDKLIRIEGLSDKSALAADNGNSLSYAPTGLTIAGAQRDHRLRIWCVANKPFWSGIAPRETESFTHFVDLRCG
jgi:YggU family uncharacterized protein